MKTFALIILFTGLTVFTACGQNKSVAQNDKSAENPVSASISSDKFTVRNFSFEITNENNECFLTYKNGKIENKLKLDVPSPCKSARWSGVEKTSVNGQERSVIKNELAFLSADKYPRIKALVFMVMTEQPNNKKCRAAATSAYQTVLVRQDEVKLGGKNVGLICVPDEINEPNFQFAAETAQP